MLASLEVVLALPVAPGVPKAPAPRPSPRRNVVTAPANPPEGKKITRDEDEIDGPATNPAGFPAMSSTLVDEDESGGTPTPDLEPMPTQTVAAIGDAVTGEAEAQRDPDSGGTVVMPHPKPKPRAPVEAESSEFSGPSEPSGPTEADAAGTVIRPHPSRPKARPVPAAEAFEPLLDGASGGTVVTAQPTGPTSSASITEPEGISAGAKAGLIAAAAVGLFLIGLAVARLFL
jgi:hypothetical protein